MTDLHDIPIPEHLQKLGNQLADIYDTRRELDKDSFRIARELDEGLRLLSPIQPGQEIVARFNKRGEHAHVPEQPLRPALVREVLIRAYDERSTQIKFYLTVSWRNQSGTWSAHTTYCLDPQVTP